MDGANLRAWRNRQLLDGAAPVAIDQIAGATVRRAFTFGGRRMQIGDRLTGDEIRALPTLNRMALIDGRYLQVEVAAGERERRMFWRGGPHGFQVIEGRGLKIVASGLSREAAEALVSEGTHA